MKASINSVIIRSAGSVDIPAMVALSEQKRLAYEQVNPQFWRTSQEANDQQSAWFAALLDREDCILLVGLREKSLTGFVIGHLVKAPEVYDPGGLTLQIDDFCIDQAESWDIIGKLLLERLWVPAKGKGAVQTLVVCGHHDDPKRSFLKSQNLNITSEWYVGAIG